MKRMLAVICLVSTFAFGEQFVTESARQIPIAAEVDVVVAGGSSGGVAAAVKAAENGASVFLISSRTYLGQDICGTMRLWLEPDEKPDTSLAKAVYKQGEPTRLLTGVPFTYTADVVPSSKHKDKSGKTLTDGKFTSASKESVQYDEDVTITADLGHETEVKTVRLSAYQRPNNFMVQSVSVSASNDGKSWSEPVTAINRSVGNGHYEQLALSISCPVDQQGRYLKIKVIKAPKCDRMLLAEIKIETADSDFIAELPADPPSPMQIKKELEDALRKAGVEFLYGCYPTDVLRDGNGELAGIVMVNRSGRQAIVAKTVIDATEHSTVARLAGAEFTPAPDGPQEFKRIVIGGEIPADRNLPMKKIGAVQSSEATEYTLSLPVRDGSFAALAKAEQIARDLTWQDKQALASEFIFPTQLPKMKGRIKNLHVLGTQQPREAMKAGTRIGAKAAKAATLPMPGTVAVAGSKVEPFATGDIGEFLQSVRGLKPMDGTFVPSLERSIPVIGKYDTVVIGGGTGGAPAGIGAARQGAKTLVVEYLHGLGGVGTIGMISSYYHGNRIGFTTEIDQGINTGGSPKQKRGWNIEAKMEWYRKELRKAGADIWFCSMGCGAFTENGKVKGVVVATPYGRGVVLCNTVIDSTGSSDIAVAAGAKYRLVDSGQFAMQGTGLSSRGLGQGYNNSDWSFVNDSDTVDRTRMHVVAKNKFEGAFDISPLILSRERRSIIGDYTLSPLDILNNRTFHDSIEQAKSDFDSHGYTTHPLLKLWFKGRIDMYAYVPYRCLLPQGLDGILVVGLGASQHRDALPIVRMQPDIQNQGYAAGVASALAVQSGTSVRGVDIRALQRHLVDVGNVPAETLTHEDSPRASRADVEQAVKDLDEEFDAAAVILDAAKEDSLPVLRRAYKSAEAPNQKLLYARVLGIMGDGEGLQTLIDEVRASEWDLGWKFTGLGNRHSGYSKVDSMIVALGKIGDKAAVPVIQLRAGELTPESDFSHFRAVALGLEAIGDSSGAGTLAGLLDMPDARGHAFLDLDKAIELTPDDQRDNSTRESSLRELIIARALYRCGDHNGIGEKILREYANDLRGLYALHARQVLGLE